MKPASRCLLPIFFITITPVLGCATQAGPTPVGPTPRPPVVAPGPAAAAAARAPDASPPAEAAVPSEPDWCTTTAYVFDAEAGARQVSLSQLLPQSEFVGVAPPQVWDADCSGIGWRHAAFSLPANSEESIEVYRRWPVHDMSPHAGPFALVGAHRAKPRAVSLNGVCLSYKANVEGEIDWILPIATEHEAKTWAARLEQGACVRPATRDD